MQGGSPNYNPRGDGFSKVVSAIFAFGVGSLLSKPFIILAQFIYTGEYEIIPWLLGIAFAYALPFFWLLTYLQSRETEKRLKKGRDIAADASRLRGEDFELIDGIATDQKRGFARPNYSRSNVHDAQYEPANDTPKSPDYILPPDKA